MALRKSLLILSIIAIVFNAAYIAPRFFLRNDMEKLAKGDQHAAEYAEEVRWLIVHLHCSQLAALTCTDVKITELQPMQVISSNDKLIPTCPYPYAGKVVIYGLFGIPLKEIPFNCNLSEV